MVKQPEQQDEVRAPGAGGEDAAKKRHTITEALIERAWSWLHATFPERQIYIRSDGRVQFFTFGATLQATLAGLALIFLGWVAFASVNVIFKDRIIASKDRHYQQMQWTYENRMADLQQSYDELNNALVGAEDRFKATADELEAKQETVSHLLGQKQPVDAIVTGAKGNAPPRDAETIPLVHATGMSSDSIGGDTPSVNAGGGSELEIMPAPGPQPRTSRPAKASFLDTVIDRFAALFFHKVQPNANFAANQPGLRILAAQTDRLARISWAETGLLEGMDRDASTRIAGLQTVLRQVGVDPNTFEQQASDVGGPYVPIQAMHIDGISDNAFTAAYADASAHAKEFDLLLAALSHVPLTTPVHGSQFEITSDFGPRVDPFTRRIAFHQGLDFGGPQGSVVGATAPGTVVWAGPRGGYGNMVEIDHGLGFHTRYAHLSQILVRVGGKVAMGSPVGKLGSTGRSTGPHVHYEVWLADQVRDPSKFIEAGRTASQ